MAFSWNNLKKPFFALAPMADVTDPAFRRIIAKYGKPEVLWTEFVSADGLCHPAGRETLLKDLQFTEAERPIIAQLFSSKPENIREAAKLCTELGFDGIDINMGCPDRTIEKQGCGSAMIKTPEVAAQVIEAAKQGIKDAGKTIPLSVKTRVGYNAENIDSWIGFLLKQNIDALTVHARTRKDMSKVPANWMYVSRVVKLRDEIAPNTVIIGNGDVASVEDGKQKSAQTGCEGIMIGRAIFGNPWLFDESRNILQVGSWKAPWYARFLPSFISRKLRGGDKRYTVSDVSIPERLLALAEHAALYEELLGDVKSFSVMKKHFKAYCTGFDGAKHLRTELMEKGNTAAEVNTIVKEFIKTVL